MDKAAEEVRNTIQNGIDLIREGTTIGTTISTLVIQIVATIILFLFVRFFLWNKVTALLDKRKANEQKALDDIKAIEEKTNELKKNADTIILEATNEAKSIYDETILNANMEKTEILNNANFEANQMIEEAKEQIDLELKKVQNEIKEEIIDTAIALSQKITKNESNKDSQNKIIDEFFSEKENSMAGKSHE